GPSWIAPRRAVVALVPREKVEEQAGLAERPFRLARTSLEQVAEELLGLAAVEEVLLVGCTLIGVTRRHRDAINAPLGNSVKEGSDAISLRGVEQSAIDVDAEAPLLGVLERRHRPVVCAGLADRVIVHLLVAVEMYRPGEEGARLVLRQLLVHQQCIGAQVDALLGWEDAAHDFRHLV